MVEIIREQDQRNIGDEFHNVALGEANLTEFAHVLIADPPPVHNDIAGEGQGGCFFRCRETPPADYPRWPSSLSPTDRPIAE